MTRMTMLSNGSAEVAGGAADRRAENEGDRDADERDAERRARGVDRAGEDVEAGEVGAEEMEEALGRPEEVDVAGDQAEELVGLAFDEEPDRPDLRRCRPRRSCAA